jgi:hypothetical protein
LLEDIAGVVTEFFIGEEGGESGDGIGGSDEGELLEGAGALGERGVEGRGGGEEFAGIGGCGGGGCDGEAEEEGEKDGDEEGETERGREGETEAHGGGKLKD